MRKPTVLFLIVGMLALSGCASGTPEAQTAAPTYTQPTTQAPTDPQSPTQVTLDQSLLLPTGPTDSGDSLTLGESGAVRRNYSVAFNDVRYITSAAQLPADEAFAKYDDAYFATGALLLVTETVNNGSVQVSVESVAVSDGVATVTLAHSLQGDMVTPVMTTWLIWVEVEPGLELQWELANPAMDSDAVRE